MRVLFAHEGYISVNGNDLYSLHYNNEYISRYKLIADKVRFIVREEDFKRNGYSQNKLDIDGFDFIGLKNYKNIFQFKNYFSTLKKIEDSVIETDYVVARLPGSIGNAAIKYALKYNKKYLVELVGCPWDALWNHSLLGKFYAPFLYIKTKKYVSSAQYVVYVTEKFLQKRYPTNGKSSNISNVVIHDSIRNIRTKRDLSKGLIRIGTIGALNLRYKGQRLVIKAINVLIKQGYNVEYQLVGGGNINYIYKEVEKNKLYKNIVFIGPLPHNEVTTWLNEIDIYIQPSKTEGLPRSLIEAMNQSCICLGSNVGGIPELLPNENIFKKNSLNDLIKVLKNAIYFGNESVELTYEKSLEFSKDKLERRRIEFFDKFTND